MVVIEGNNMPDELYYHKDHAWVKLEADGTVRVGMNDFYQKSAGDTTYIDLPFEGDEVSQGETCGKIQSAKWVGKFVSPLSGEIMKVNDELEDDCTLINKDPYDKGWIMIIKPSNLDEELKNLAHGKDVEPWLKKEIEEAEKVKK
ncbi:MAG: glycine cleavage system protein GcvH [Thermoplasmatales archaeon]|nr:glycine cleavage system protein GcvH [Thermoplasmatales archaeon]